MKVLEWIKYFFNLHTLLPTVFNSFRTQIIGNIKICDPFLQKPLFFYQCRIIPARDSIFLCLQSFFLKYPHSETLFRKLIHLPNRSCG